MHTTMVPEQVKTMKIQAGIQVSRPRELTRQLQLWKRFGRLYLIVFVLVRNIFPEVKGWLDEDLDNYHLKELRCSTQCHTQKTMWIISRGVVLLILLMLGIGFKFSISGLLHQVITTIADIIQDKDTSQSKQNLQSSSMTFIHKTLIIPSVLDSCFISSTASEDKMAVQPDAYSKLIEAGPHRWLRAHCLVLCYSYMTSNSVESVNACIVLKRKLPITMLTETYHAMVQDWYCKRREVAANMKYEITNWVADKVHKRKLKSAAWIVNDINQYQYQVLDGRYNREVNIITGSCECCKWQLSGITYGHVIAVTRFLGLTDYVQFIEDWFKKINIKALMRNQFILLEICKNGNF
ncbi:hypothetical protein Tco_1483326 [Tanacetum coccineum]